MNYYVFRAEDDVKEGLVVFKNMPPENVMEGVATYVAEFSRESFAIFLNHIGLGYFTIELIEKYLDYQLNIDPLRGINVSTKYPEALENFM